MKKIIAFILIATIAVFAKGYGYKTSSSYSKGTYHSYSSYKTPRYTSTSYMNSKGTSGSGIYYKSAGYTTRSYSNSKGYYSNSTRIGHYHTYTNSNGVYRSYWK